eukprot:SAG31_NODE_312_length_17856_cov_14.557827_10_plen_100_part_00
MILDLVASGFAQAVHRGATTSAALARVDFQHRCVSLMENTLFLLSTWRSQLQGPGTHDVRNGCDDGLDYRWMRRGPGYSFGKAKRDADDKRTLSKAHAS